MANTFREVYKKTGTSSYQLVGNVGVGGVKLDVMKGATSSTAGEIGLVPKPSAGSVERYLSANGTFKEISGIGDISSLTTENKNNLVSAVNELNECRLHWTTLNTPSVYVGSKGFAELILNIDALVGYYFIAATLIGATKNDYLAQVVVAGASRVFNEEKLLYVKLFNNHSQGITSVYQIAVWFAKP